MARMDTGHILVGVTAVVDPVVLFPPATDDTLATEHPVRHWQPFVGYLAIYRLLRRPKLEQAPHDGYERPTDSAERTRASCSPGLANLQTMSGCEDVKPSIVAVVVCRPVTSLVALDVIAVRVE